MLGVFQSIPQGPIVKGVIRQDGNKDPWTDKRYPEDRDWVRHLLGKEFVGLIPDKALCLDLDHHTPDQLGTLLEVLRELGLPAYYGPSTTRGSKVWIFAKEPGREVLEATAEALADLAKVLDYSPCEPFPHGTKPVILPFFGALNGNRRPFYTPDGQEAWPVNFQPVVVSLEHLKRVRLAVSLFLTALIRKPVARHDTAMAFLNLATRFGVEELLAVLMGTEALYKAWEMDDGSRDLRTWRGEVERLVKTAKDPYKQKRGIPFLRDQGYELPQEVLEALPLDLRYPEPLPLYRQVGEPEPYPVDALGPLAEVVKETARIAQVPLPMAANSFLAAASYATQGLVDVLIDGRIHPTSLYFLTIAKSGERKTHVDRVATRPILDWAEELRLRLRDLRIEYEAAKEAIEAERKRVLANKSLSLEEKEARLRELVPPSPPWGGFMLMTDPTMEALVRTLATGWPVAGIFANEAGMFLGGWSMSEDQRLRTYSVLSALWDGQPLDRVRVGDGYTYLVGRRLAVHLMGQPEAVKEFLNDRLAHGQGILGRFLIVHPQSLMGSRTYVEANPTATPAFQEYHRIMTELLYRVMERVLRQGDREAKLEFDRLTLNQKAKELWKDYYHDVEARLPKEEMQAVLPLANKIADYSTRIAGVLTLIQDPEAFQIDERAMEWGVVLAEYYLCEAQRLAGGYRIPEHLRQAEKLLNWLKGYLRKKGRREFHLAEVFTYGPSEVRSADAARRILKNLERLGYVLPLSEVVIDGRRRREAWELNPLVGQEEGQVDPGPGGPGGGWPVSKTSADPLAEVAELADMPSLSQISLLKSEPRVAELAELQQDPLDGGVVSSAGTSASSARPPQKFSNGKADNEGTSASSASSATPLAEIQGSTPYRYLPYPSQEELAEVRGLLMTQEVVGFDLETTGLDPLKDRIRLITFSWPSDGKPTAVLLDVGSTDPSHVLEVLRPLFEAKEGPTLIGHNLAFDLSFLMRHGIRPTGRRLWDIGIAHQVLNGQGYMPKLEALIPGLDKTFQKADWSGELNQGHLDYAAKDALVLLNLYSRQVQEVQEHKLSEVMELEMRALPAVVWAKLEGVPVSRAVLKEELAKAKAVELETLARLKVYGDINWRSHSQALKVLKKYGLDVPNTKAETLAPYADRPLVQALLAYREASKRVSFLEGLTKHIHPQTGRIHPDWKLVGADTGRMTCREPNLQQVPRDNIRRVFRAPEGWAVIKADYSQIELRLAAAIASDLDMAIAFQRGVDLHTLTAQRVLGVPNPTKEDRQKAKALNFGLIYGMGAEGLKVYAKTGYGVDMTLAEAEKYRQAFFDLYRGLKQWHKIAGEGETEVRTLLGRRRITDKYTEKLNTPVQGSGADGLKLALARLYERRHEVPGVVPILFVHDELVVLATEEKAQEAAEWLAQVMLEAMEEVIGRTTLKVPVEVEYAICEDWGITVLQQGKVPSAKKEASVA